MDNTERKILRDIADRLEISTMTSWERGDLDLFKTWAVKMRETINTITPILRTISNSEIEKPKINNCDIEDLNWIYEKLISQNHQSPNDEMLIKLKGIIHSFKQNNDGK
jgi:hypothetical protein